MEPDYNAYAQKLGYNVSFSYLIDDAAGQPNVHLSKVQGFKAIDVNIFIGGGWSSEAQASLSYCNDNNMLMWSASSTSPILAIANDNLYRMCPDDTIQAPAIAAMLKSYGIKAIILIQRGDAWADGIYNYLSTDFENGGGIILERVRYAQETTEFSNYLQTAENDLGPAIAKYGKGHVGIELLAFTEGVTMVTQAQDFNLTYSVPWFGSDGTTFTQQFIDDAGEQSSHVHIYSTLAAPAHSSKYDDLYARYEQLVSQPFSYYTACTYDIGWILTETILESQSTDPAVVIPLQQTDCLNSYGSSGWNKLNDAGDRAAANYEIWGYGDIGQGIQNVNYGLYDQVTQQVTWYSNVLGFTPSPAT
jgi:branched-chain amino acid transport system substrate-binding protein